MSYTLEYVRMSPVTWDDLMKNHIEPRIEEETKDIPVRFHLKHRKAGIRIELEEFRRVFDDAPVVRCSPDMVGRFVWTVRNINLSGTKYYPDRVPSVDCCRIAAGKTKPFITDLDCRKVGMIFPPKKY